MPIPIAALVAGIGAIGGIGNSLIASNTARRNTERTIQANMGLAQYAYGQDKIMAEEAYKRDIAMWERQMAYNSPEAQRARLEAAGLNPNLVYGQGTVAGNVSTPAPQFKPPSFNPPDVQYRNIPIQLPDVISAYQDFSLRQAQIDSIKAQTENTQARTINESMQKVLLEITGNRELFDLGRRQELAPYQQQITEHQARREALSVEQTLQALKLMGQEETLKALETRYRTKGLELQDVELEAREADLLFKKYRNQWMEMGVTSGDNVALRVIIRMLKESGLSLDAFKP